MIQTLKLIEIPLTWTLRNNSCGIRNFATKMNLSSDIRIHDGTVLQIETRNRQVPCLNNSKNIQTEIQESITNTTTSYKGDVIIPSLSVTTVHLEEVLVRDGDTKEVFMPLSSYVVLK